MIKNIKILDCTLRDGGRIIDCHFPDREIEEISRKLSEAKIDMVEIGFLRDPEQCSYTGDSTFFTDTVQMRPFINRNFGTKYLAFVDYELYNFDLLTDNDGSSIHGIRVGFTRDSFLNRKEDIKKCLQTVKDRGYELFIQGVNTPGYTDGELIDLIDLVNQMEPSGFGIVDTYGSLYMDELDRIYGIVDHNLEESVQIDFHSHNNMQLSFALAQEIIRLSGGKRKLIIDCTLDGMGKCAGNLNTELLVHYLMNRMSFDYEFDSILDIIDSYIYKYYEKEQWGYTIPAFMAGIYKAHPNNIIYLTEKFSLESKDIKYIVSTIDADIRQQYDYDNIEKIYIEYTADKVDDYDAVNGLRKTIGDREVLILVPGSSLNTYEKSIKDYVLQKEPVIISTNFVTEDKNAWAFYGNQKKYTRDLSCRNDRNIIVTSNIKNRADSDITVNYEGLINRGYEFFENSTIMLLNLLKRIGVKKISIAGFDGFDRNAAENYVDASFLNSRAVKNYEKLNREIRCMFTDYVKTVKDNCELQFLTPGIFTDVLQKY